MKIKSINIFIYMQANNTGNFMFQQVASNLPIPIYREFRKAIVTGYWSNGMLLTDKQRRTCEQALFFHEQNQTDICH